jgi:tRNA pseudouridine38-40 synthase
VQAVVEQALSEVLGAKVEVHGAARTDAGVHAAGQVCHFVRQALGAEDPAGITAFAAALRGRLPQGIRLLAAALAHPSFHARSSSTGKRYVYRYSWGTEPQSADRFHLGPSARPDWLRAAAALEGLAGLPALPGLASPSKDRRPAPPLTGWTLDHEQRGDGGVCQLELRAHAFRKHQVRNVAGHLAAVALGLAEPETLAKLAQRTRPWMGATAPPAGLTLVEVVYPPELDPFAPAAHDAPPAQDPQDAAPAEGLAPAPAVP